MESHDWIDLTQFADFASQEGGDVIADGHASNTIDGNTSTYNHTPCGSPNDQFWQVDFGSDVEISKIIMTLRDSGGERINGARIELDEQILVSDLSFSEDFTDYRIDLDLDEVVKGSVLRVFRPGPSYACNALHIAEIEVYGGLCDM